MKTGLGVIFPNGIHEVSLNDFSDLPKSGVFIANENELVLKSGLKKGTIIVALDGKRTENFVQYGYVRGLTTSPHMELIVYQDGKYQLIKAGVPERRFWANFVSWTRK